MARRNTKRNPKSGESKTDQSTTTSKSDETKEEKVEASKVSPSNDPAWYANDEALLRDAASFPYSYPLGQVIDYKKGAGSGATVTTIDSGDVGTLYTVPGICTLKLKPSIGINRNRNDPANVCANAFYTHVRYVNSGRKNYDPADLMIYALTIADIYSFIMWCQRLYAYSFTYSQRNKYIAKELIRANTVDADDLMNNLASFRYWLNAFINKASSFVVPSDIALFKRKAFMYSGYYIENSFGNIKDQLYQFAPEGFFKFEVSAINNAGSLVYTKLKPTGLLLKVSEIMTYGDALLANIWGDEDFGLMSGDILKAYGSNIIGLAAMPEEMSLVPEFDFYVLSQFKNATVINGLAREGVTALADTPTYTIGGKTYRAGNIYQNPSDGNILSSEALEKPDSGNPSLADIYWDVTVAASKLLSVENPDPTPSDTIEASRLTLMSERHYGGAYGWDSQTCDIYGGDYICVMCDCSYGKWDDTSSFQFTEGQLGYNAMTETNFQAQLVYLRNALRYSPMLYTFEKGGTAAAPNVHSIRCVSNVDNYTVVGLKEIQRMHECALLSLMHVPGVAKLVNNL